MINGIRNTYTNSAAWASATSTTKNVLDNKNILIQGKSASGSNIAADRCYISDEARRLCDELSAGLEEFTENELERGAALDGEENLPEGEFDYESHVIQDSTDSEENAVHVVESRTALEREEDLSEEEFDYKFHTIQDSTDSGENAVRTAWYEAFKKIETDADSIIGKIKTIVTDTPVDNEFKSKWGNLLDQIEEKETKIKDAEARQAILNFKFTGADLAAMR